MLRKDHFRTPAALTSLAFLFAGAVFTARSPLMLSCADTGWHILAGQAILRSGSIPSSDPWSFTAGAYWWMNLSWLWDCAAAVLERLSGGLSLPLAANILVNALTLALLVGTARKSGIRDSAITLAFPAAVVAFSFGAALRPQQITFLLFASLLGALFGEGRPRAAPAKLPLFLLFALWANCHGGFLAGLLLFAGWSLESCFASPNRWRSALLAATAVLFGIIFNPLGPMVFAAAARTLAGPLRTIISEWQPIPLDRSFLPYYPWLILGGLGCALPDRTTRFSLTERILGIGFLVAACTSQRHLPIFVLLSFRPAARLLERLLIDGTGADSRIGRSLTSFDNDFGRLNPARPFAIAAVATLALLLSGVLRLLPAEIPASFPVAEEKYIEAHFPGRRWLNFYFDGGYLLYLSGGALSLFIDGRAETAYPPEVVNDYLAFYHTAPGWDRIIDRWRIDGAIVPKNTGWSEYFAKQSDWSTAYEGPWRVVFVKRSEPRP